ncbi:MAG: NAD(P)H-dependent oxidoreductase subunit E [Myxococcota bacterium]|nr:NAD(P)H-dependent oxidoreductase subunit E [Myxococcota bacterium]MDW8361260.1 NAD(P)H-dependent oxidoreductase subunit E [Myxococcales bacterium]
MSHNLIALRRGPDRFDVHGTALQRLKQVMEERRVITADDVRAVARACGQPEAAVWGVATFYGDLSTEPRGRRRVRVCRGSACHAEAGDAPVRWLERALGLRLGQTSPDGSVSLEPVYCLGFCHAAPVAAVERHVVARLDEKAAQRLARSLDAPELPDAQRAAVPPCVVGGGPAIVLERLRHQGLDATRLEVARAHGVFEGLRRALQMTPDEVIAVLEGSGLRGRGGAGFPTGRKWRLAAPHARAADEAFVVANGDEGDPGSYIDKALMERDPFALLEGMAICARAIGARRGVVYVRSEYPHATPRLRDAVEQARSAGLLGERVLGTPFAFDVDVVEGAGSYVCGEETALLRSLEGLRGMVTARPPYPAERGLFERPTVVHNVETLANLGWILRHGADAYAAWGTEQSRGTKCFCFNGLFEWPGIYEVPLGLTLRGLVEEVAGGLRVGHRIKAVQVGGPLGGILPAHELDVRLGFEEMAARGALLGHGSVVAWDERTSARAIAEHLLEFAADESCGKCFPCRIGTHRALEIVRRLDPARPAAERRADAELLLELLETMRLGSLCAHGGAIPDPIASLFRHFGAELLGEPMAGEVRA